MRSSTTALIALIVLFLNSGCLYFFTVHVPLAIEGCPGGPAVVGESFQLSVTHDELENDFIYDEFVWTVTEGEVQFSDTSPKGRVFSIIEVIPQQGGQITIEPHIVFIDAVNLAEPVSCTFEVVTE